MLLNSVVIVVREALEAALLLSVLMATSRILRGNSRWVAIAVPLGLLGAAVYGHYLPSISNLFDGVGQELFNASIQFVVFAMLTAIIFLINGRSAVASHRGATLAALMTAAVALAITREASEILVFLSGFLQTSQLVSSVGLGSFVGVCIGVSVGVLFYFLLLALPSGRAVPAATILLGLAGAGMCLQATGLLIQADWISVAAPLWNTSGMLPEDSIPGQLLYALIGYEASPSAKEVTVYATSLAIMAVALFAGRFLLTSNEDTA